MTSTLLKKLSFHRIINVFDNFFMTNKNENVITSDKSAFISLYTNCLVLESRLDLASSNNISLNEVSQIE